MDSVCVCVYEDKTVTHELSQGLQMAQQLRVHLHSPDARDFYIQMILSSYYNALSVLRLGYSARQLPSLTESLISFESPGMKEFEFNQSFLCQQGENGILRKRKGSTTWDDQARASKVQKCFAAKPVQRSDEMTTNYHRQLSPQSPREMLSNLRANLSVNTSDLRGDSGIIPSFSSFPLTSFGSMKHSHQLHISNHHDDELIPLFISPVTSESHYFHRVPG